MRSCGRIDPDDGKAKRAEKAAILRGLLLGPGFRHRNGLDIGRGALAFARRPQIAQTSTLETDSAATSLAGAAALPTRPHQAIALRRRRIRDPLVARADTVEFTCGCVRDCGRLRRAA